MRFNWVSQDAFDGFQLDAGVLLSKFDPEEEIEDEDIICPTTGGIKASCIPTYEDLGEDIYGVKANCKELKYLSGWECTLEFTTTSASIDTLAMVLGACEIDGSMVSPRVTLDQDDYMDEVWWVGDRADGGYVYIKLEHALSTEGLSLQTASNGYGEITCTLTGHTDGESVPMTYYVGEPEVEEEQEEDEETKDVGDTLYYITLTEDMATVTIYLAASTADSAALIDWGDDSDPEPTTSTDVTGYSHTYDADSGDERVITISTGSGTCWPETPTETLHVNTPTSNGNKSTSEDSSVTGCDLDAIEIGTSVSKIGRGAFIGHTIATKATDKSNIDIGAVSSIGSYAFAINTSLRSFPFPDDATSIKSYAFARTGLQVIHLPEYTSSIGAGAFMVCRAIRSISFPDHDIEIGSNAFSCSFAVGFDMTLGNCTTTFDSFALSRFGGLYFKDDRAKYYMATMINLWDDEEETRLDSIESPATIVFGSGVCAGVDALETVTANRIPTIGDCCFYDAEGLTSVTTDKVSLATIGSRAFAFCESLTTIPELASGLTEISKYAFYECSALTSSIAIPATCTTIGKYAFYECSAVTDWDLGSSLETVGDGAFYHCSGLTGPVDLSSCTSVGDSAFYNCTSLEDLTLGDYLAEIGSYAFYKCTAITSTGALPEPCVSVGSYAFYQCLYVTSISSEVLSEIGASAFREDTSLASVSVDEMTSLGQYAFYGCTSLGRVDLGTSGINISKYAFYGCTSLVTISMPEVTGIGDYAFYGCTSLEEISLSSDCTSIGAQAFRGCTSLATVDIGSADCEIDESAFYGCDSLETITIGGETVDAETYKVL